MTRFEKNIMKLMDTDNLNEACEGWTEFYGNKREIDGVCICGKVIKYTYFLHNDKVGQLISVGSECVRRLKELKGSKFYRFNCDMLFSKLLKINKNNFLNLIKNLNNEEYKEYVYEKLIELILNFKCLRDCNNLKYSLIEAKENSILFDFRIDNLLELLDKKIIRLEQWKENKENERKRIIEENERNKLLKKINEENERNKINEEDKIKFLKRIKELNEYITYEEFLNRKERGGVSYYSFHEIMFYSDEVFTKQMWDNS
jgi:hypothetical protein